MTGSNYEGGTTDACYHCSVCRHYKVDPEDHLHGTCKQKRSERWDDKLIDVDRRTRWNDRCRKFKPNDEDSK